MTLGKLFCTPPPMILVPVGHASLASVCAPRAFGTLVELSCTYPGFGTAHAAQTVNVVAAPVRFVIPTDQDVPVA